MEEMQWYWNSVDGAYLGSRKGDDLIVSTDRPSPLHTFDGTYWQGPPEPTLDELKTAKLDSLSVACTAEINQGFSSSVLGLPHWYNGEMDNQINFIGSIMMGVDVPHTCTNMSDGIKMQRIHTNAQIKQAFQTGGLAKAALKARYNGLRLQVNAAATPEEIAAIVW